MRYAIFNWIDGSIDYYPTEQEAVFNYHGQLAEHKRFKKEEDSEAEFDKMVVKIIDKYNDVD